MYPTQSVVITATVTGSTNTAVNWNLSSANCTGSACGTLTPVTPATTPATATYVAPATPVSQVVITATAVASSSATDTLTVSSLDVTTDVAPSAVSPATLSIGTGLTQQFTAVAVPDAAPQIFTWTCTANGAPCGASFVQDSNISGLAYYTASNNCGSNCVQISAASTLDPTGCTSNPTFCTTATASLVASRVNGTYAFRFSGYDSSNNPVAVAGTFTALNGTITGGTEDELTSVGPAPHAISAGTYTPITASDPNSNNAGTLTLTLPANIYPNQYRVVLDGNGDIQMIESDGHGSGSGVAKISAASTVFKNKQTFAFGFTGVDGAGKRIGYAGILPMDGAGNITDGSMDVNDNGSNSNSICNTTPPCTVAGTYTTNGNGSWKMTLTSPAALTFNFYIASGSTNKATPLTFYAISTAPNGSPAVSGTIVLQDSTVTYDTAHFKGTAVSALTGVDGGNANVSLTEGTTDGKGGFSGVFDQNDAGTILASATFPPTGSTSYTYAASGTSGRYVIQMLGNPTASTPVAPIPFVLYASGQNRGFLLDQSSASVMTGTMNPQAKASGGFANSVLPGTYAAATTGSFGSTVNPIAGNLLFIYPGSGAANTVSGTEYLNPPPTSQTLTGTYNLTGVGSGTGVVTLTPLAAQNYVIYAVDASGCTATNPVCAIEDFFMMDVDKTNTNASIIFGQQ
jgi:hypothetical protein